MPETFPFFPLDAFLFTENSPGGKYSCPPPDRKVPSQTISVYVLLTKAVCKNGQIFNLQSSPLGP